MFGFVRRTSIATSTFVLSFVALLGVAGISYAALAIDVRSSAEGAAADRSLDVALALASVPEVRELTSAAFERMDSDRAGAIELVSNRLEPYVLDVVDSTGIDYVTIMHPDRTRYTHPNASLIGGEFLGSIEPALHGVSFTEIYAGTLGPSMRAVVPVEVSGEVVALVSAGVTIDNVAAAIAQRLAVVIAVLLVTLTAAAIMIWVVSQRLKRATGGHDAETMARLFVAHEAALHSVDDGLVLIDEREIVLANDRARELLALEFADADALPIALDDARLSPRVRETLDALSTPHGAVARSSEGNADEYSMVVEGRALSIRRTTAALRGRRVATVLALRDQTELRKIAGELDAVSTIAAALRAQTHEFGNRLHTIAALIEVGKADRALEYAAQEYDLGQRLTDRVMGAIDEPIIAALLLGKAAQARERSVRMHFETHLPPGTQWLEPGDFVTVLGNLVDNAIDAAAAGLQQRQGSVEIGDGTDDILGWVEVYLAFGDGDELVMQVSDNGVGILQQQRQHIFERGWSSKDAAPYGRGFGLAIVRSTLERLGGSIEIESEPLEHQGTKARDRTSASTVATVTIPRPDARIVENSREEVAR